MLGGLWPAELATRTADTAPLADYLNVDLQRIANSANEKLHAISRSDLAGQARQAAEARVINVARAFAVLRVESTVRQLHKEALEFRTQHSSLNPVPAPVSLDARSPVSSATPPRPVAPAAPPDIVEVSAEPEVVRPHHPAEPRLPLPGPRVFDGADGEQSPPPTPRTGPQPEPAPPTPVAPTVAESGEQRLQRLLAFVARQEPGLRWAIGTYADGSTRLATDIANGWIPSGIELPAGVQLLEPGLRTGTATEMLGIPTESAAYSPGDRLGWASDFGATDTSLQPRALTAVADLGWQLSEATHWREGLPRMANTLAKAGSAGTGVIAAEIDLLRVHLDTMRYQLMAQYPGDETALVLNCMLLAATEGIATGDLVSANYHYSWFRTLRESPAGQWDPQG